MANTSRLAVYPGSFDPLTNGHVDIIERGLRLFDRIVVAVLTNPSKQPLFRPDERAAIIREVFSGQANVEVDMFDGLLVDYVRRRGATAIVRGVRVVSDFEYEWQMALMNRHLDAAIDTVFLMPSERFTYVSATLVREIAALGGPLTGLVPPAVEARLATRRQTSTSRRV
jgi:pantetheine-phosphate adenylyltransferase